MLPTLREKIQPPPAMFKKKNSDVYEPVDDDIPRAAPKRAEDSSYKFEFRTLWRQFTRLLHMFLFDSTGATWKFYCINSVNSKAWFWLFLACVGIAYENAVLVMFSYVQRDFTTALSKREEEGFYKGITRYMGVVMLACITFPFIGALVIFPSSKNSKRPLLKMVPLFCYRL